MIKGTGFGLAGQNGQEMTNGDTPTIGYRGVGYNPNFAHADEYPPSQEHVQIQKEPIDLSKHLLIIFVCFSNIQYFSCQIILSNAFRCYVEQGDKNALPYR